MCISPYSNILTYGEAFVKKLKINLWYIISPFTDNTHRVKNDKRRNLYMKATGIVRRIEECVIIGQKLKKPHKWCATRQVDI